jgi:enamine deaminase RidA (YjgF/YER057c/UK114 family)
LRDKSRWNDMTDTLDTSPRSAEARMAALGLTLPPPRPPIGSFAPVVTHGDLCFLSGQGPVGPDGVRHTGRIGETSTVEEVRAHARLTTVNLLSALRNELGSLDRVRQVVRMFGMVNAIDTFSTPGAVIADAVDLLIDVFGEEIGRPSGSAVGMGSLPNDITVEIELIVAIDQ